MPSIATLSETYIGRTVTTGVSSYDTEQIYQIFNAADQFDAATTLANQTPLTIYGGLLRRTATEAKEVESISGLYEGRCTYSFIGATKQSGDTSFNFDTSGGTQHIVSNISTKGKFPPEAPDPKGIINAKESGTADGLDINVPVWAFTGTIYLPFKNITTDYMRSIYITTGKVNNAPITLVLDGITQSFDTGELKFDGATGARRGSGEMEISFKFGASPNRTNITIGNITGITKGGWEYLEIATKKTDVSYTPKDTQKAVSVIRLEPRFVYCHEIFASADFTKLQIPSS